MIETHLRRCSNEKAKLVSSPSRIRNEQWKEAYRERKHRDKEEKSLQLFLSASTENPVKKGGNGDLSTGGGKLHWAQEYKRIEVGEEEHNYWGSLT